MVPQPHPHRHMPPEGSTPHVTQDVTARGIAYAGRPGDRMPIVLVHGSGFSKAIFANQFRSRTLADHPLVAIDLPGHGHSADAADPRRTYSYAGLADAILGAIDDLALGPCILAGWSLGGQAALELVDRQTAVRGVMAFGAPPAPAGALGLVQAMHVSRTLLLAGKAAFSEAEARDFERAALGLDAEPRFTETLRRTDRRLRPSISRSILFGSGTRGIGQNERLARARIPVCLLHGANDPLVRTSYMQGLAAPMLHEGRAIILPDAGHAPFLDSAPDFERILAGFARAVARGGAALTTHEDRDAA